MSIFLILISLLLPPNLAFDLSSAAALALSLHMPLETGASAPRTRPPTYSVLQEVPEKRKIVRQQQDYQDNRLKQCEEKGHNWEQCFFYGTDTVSQSRDGGFLKARQTAVPGGPPTW